MLTLIGGGARSGKSSYALSLGNSAIDAGKRALFVATAEAVDDEMEQRIAKHKDERRSEYDLIEEPRELAKVLTQASDYDIVIVDCLTLWLSNLMLENIEPDFENVIEAGRYINTTVVFVTNETGEGIVPMHPISRKFRDLSGQMNVAFAKVCDQVVIMKFGIPLVLKGIIDVK
ncbi:MAG: bifunctional adenosylcobinamide kinase/adenosylcobinamide-phosphate guanylyltransferase [Actinobacteria bacterium]|nr:bifunctional adenosylcobinamide kinase/adenosylcobinamide-phosphate guanylyltransferase [Actinomycetota bacterium]